MTTYLLTRAQAYLSGGMPPKLVNDPAKAWRTSSLDAAIDRQTMLRHAFGMAADIRSEAAA